MNHHISSIIAKAFFIGMLAFCAGCCKVATQSEITSPSGAQVASVTVINCGAFTHYVTNVNLRNANTSPSLQDGIVVSVPDKVWILVEWTDDHTLFVYLPKSAIAEDFVGPKLKVQKAEVNGVHIEYRVPSR
jgi:hypothetical protein